MIVWLQPCYAKGDLPMVTKRFPCYHSEKGLRVLNPSNNFWEHSKIVQHKTKLGVLGGAKSSGSFGFNPLQSNPLKPFSQYYNNNKHAQAAGGLLKCATHTILVNTNALVNCCFSKLLFTSTKLSVSLSYRFVSSLIT